MDFDQICALLNLNKDGKKKAIAGMNHGSTDHVDHMIRASSERENPRNEDNIETNSGVNPDQDVEGVEVGKDVGFKPNVEGIVHSDMQNAGVKPNVEGIVHGDMQDKSSDVAGATKVGRREAQKSFAEALKGNSERISYELPIPYKRGEFMAVKIPKRVVQKGLEYCKFALVGRLDLSKITLAKVSSIVEKKWKLKNSFKLILLGRGYFLIKLENEEDMFRVWRYGPWLVEDQVMHIQQWSTDFDVKSQRVTHANVWVRLPGLRQHLWDEEAVFSIARTIGCPIALDKNTKARSFGTFASVLVQVDLTKPIPNKVIVEIEDGVEFVQDVEPMNVPKFCHHCKIIGHLANSCRKLEKEAQDRHEEEERKKNKKREKKEKKVTNQEDKSNNIHADVSENEKTTDDKTYEDGLVETESDDSDDDSSMMILVPETQTPIEELKQQNNAGISEKDQLASTSGGGSPSGAGASADQDGNDDGFLPPTKTTRKGNNYVDMSPKTSNQYEILVYSSKRNKKPWGDIAYEEEEKKKKIEEAKKKEEDEKKKNFEEAKKKKEEEMKKKKEEMEKKKVSTVSGVSTRTGPKTGLQK